MKRIKKLLTYYRFSLPIFIALTICLLILLNYALTIVLLFTGGLSCGPLGCFTPIASLGFVLLIPGMLPTLVNGIYADPFWYPVCIIGGNFLFYFFVGWLIERALHKGSKLNKKHHPSK
jgi:hypothetical protein